MHTDIAPLIQQSIARIDQQHHDLPHRRTMVLEDGFALEHVKGPIWRVLSHKQCPRHKAPFVRLQDRDGELYCTCAWCERTLGEFVEGRK